MKISGITCLTIVSLVGLQCTFGQGFVNLDFESTTIPQDQAPGMVSTNELPGWKAGAAINESIFGDAQELGFNNPITSGERVSILGTNSGNVIEGGYSLLLQIGAMVTSPSISSVFISQTALVPAGSQSILFKAQPGAGAFGVTLGGQNIPLTAQFIGPNYTLYGGDISAFANQTLELKFKVLKSSQQNNWVLDSIVFSPSPVPEPSPLSLCAIGGFYLTWRMRCFKKQRRHKLT